MTDIPSELSNDAEVGRGSSASSVYKWLFCEALNIANCKSRLHGDSR